MPRLCQVSHTRSGVNREGSCVFGECEVLQSQFSITVLIHSVSEVRKKKGDKSILQ